jgi:hypothetical protein
VACKEEWTELPSPLWSRHEEEYSNGSVAHNTGNHINIINSHFIIIRTQVSKISNLLLKIYHGLTVLTTFLVLQLSELWFACTDHGYKCFLLALPHSDGISQGWHRIPEHQQLIRTKNNIAWQTQHQDVQIIWWPNRSFVPLDCWRPRRREELRKFPQSCSIM